MEKRDLKEYIVKLNDRNIQRQRETGFTLYAILGAIVYCLFYLIDNIEVPIKIFNEPQYLIVASYTANTIFALSFLFLSYGASTRRQQLTKIFPYSQPLRIDVEDYPIFFSLIIIGFLNFWLLQYQDDLFQKIVLCFFGMLTTVNIISPFAIKLFGVYKQNQKEKKGQTIEVFDFTMFNEKSIRSVSLGSLLYGTLLCLLLFISIILSTFEFDLKHITQVIRYLLILFALLYLLKISMNIKSKQHENNRLEDFEKEIFFENISNEEIAQKFEKEFDGIPFSKWINNKQKEIMEFFDLQRQTVLAQNLLLIDIENINKNDLPFDYSGRLQVVINNQATMLSQTTDFVQKVTNSFNNLKNFSSLNDNEVQKLNYVQHYLNQNIMSFNNQYTNLSNQITARQNS